MWDRLDDHNPYDDLDITNDRIGRWHPLNQSLYVGYKVMLAGLLMISKGDRIAMQSSVETRYPFLDDDVIAFSAGIAPEYKLRGHDREVDSPPGRRPNPAPARSPTVPRRCSGPALAQTFLGPHRPAWVDQLLSPESLRRHRLLRPRDRCQKQRRLQTLLPRITPRRDSSSTSASPASSSTQLWHHLYCGGGLCDLPVWTPPVSASN